MLVIKKEIKYFKKLKNNINFKKIDIIFKNINFFSKKPMLMKKKIISIFIKTNVIF